MSSFQSKKNISLVQPVVVLSEITEIISTNIKKIIKKLNKCFIYVNISLE